MNKNGIQNTIIDIGTNSARLNICDVYPDKVKFNEKLWVPIAIGRDIYNKGLISNNTLNDLLQIINNFKIVLNSYKIIYCRAVGSSGIREARNCDKFIERIYHETGIRIDIFEPIVEAHIMYEGIKNIIGRQRYFQNENILYFIIGTGVTIIIFQSKGKIVFTETRNFGTLRLLKISTLPLPSIEEFVDYTSSKLLTSSLWQPEEMRRIDRIVIVNDELQNLLQKTAAGIEKDCVSLPFLKYSKYVADIGKQKETHLQDTLHMHDTVVKTAKIAMKISERLGRKTNVKNMIFPNINRSTALLPNLHNYQDDKKLADKNETWENIISSAIEIGRKYKFDYTHSMIVRKFANIIFEKIKDYYNFEQKSGLYLETAAILHDIGYYISPKDHHINSAALIISAEIMGLTSYEMNVVSLIAKYHRKLTSDNPASNDFAMLPSNHRVMIICLAGIIRIAEALDKTHNQMVEDIAVVLDEEEDEITIKIKIRDNQFEHIEILRMLVYEKAFLFHSIFGLTVKLQKM